MFFCGSGAWHGGNGDAGGGGGRGRGTVDAQTQGLRHSEGCASTPWNPQLRGMAARCQWTRETQTLRHSEATQWPWNPLLRGTRPTVDAGELCLFPSSSRSGDPPVRGNAVRRRGRGNSSFPSFRGRRPWNPLLRGMAASSVDAGELCLFPPSSRSGDPPLRGNAVRHRYLSATNSGIPARSARMTADFERQGRYPGGTNGGILRSLTLPLNDSR